MTIWVEKRRYLIAAAALACLLTRPGLADDVGQTALEDLDPFDRYGYAWSRDREYISYIEALDLNPDTKDRLWLHLTSKYQALAELDLLAEQELGSSYESEVDFLVITYDQDSDHFRRREELQKRMDEELRGILTDEQLTRHQRYTEVKSLERNRRKLKHEIEDMELDLRPVQFEVAVEVFENKPAFFQKPAGPRGATGYSIAYMQERERWRFDQEQDYLEAKLVPILDDEQVKHFQKWQEAQRVKLRRSLDMYKRTEEFMAQLYPEQRRRVKMLSPQPLSSLADKRPAYIECRNNQLFRIPLEEIRAKATERLKEIAQETQGNTRSLMQELAAARVETDAYRADLTYALLAQLALRPKRFVEGYELNDIQDERPVDWYGSILETINPEEELLTFVVRDDSLEVFEKARTLAEAKKIDITYELLDPIAPIKFGLGGVPAIVSDRTHGDKYRSELNGENGKSPSYVEVHRDHVILYPGGETVDARDIEEPNTDLTTFLDRVEQSKDTEYVVLLLHPHSAILANRLKKVLRRRGIDVGERLHEQDQPANL